VSAALSERKPIPWLAQHGPKEIELLLRAVLFHPSAPVLLADDDRRYLEASFGASKLLGRPRENSSAANWMILWSQHSSR
jgi:PAS domain-containing protein